MSFYTRILGLAIAVLGLVHAPSASGQESDHDVAYEWIEAQLKGIRVDFARPPIHARNLYHVSLAMYDAWAAYDEVAEPMLLGHTVGGYTAEFDGIPENILPFLDIPEARKEAVSYAAYRVLTHRYSNSPGVVTSQARFDSLLTALGYDPSITSNNYLFGSPAALGNYIAEQVIAFGLQDGANEAFDYTNTYYEPFNDQLWWTTPETRPCPTPTGGNRWPSTASWTNPVRCWRAPRPSKVRNGVGCSPSHLEDDQMVMYERDGELWPTGSTRALRLHRR